MGERRPDDETDRVVHRGGRFINNMYVPDPAPDTANKFARVPEEVVIRAEFGPGPELARTGRSYEDVSIVKFNCKSCKRYSFLRATTTQMSSHSLHSSILSSSSSPEGPLCSLQTTRTL